MSNTDILAQLRLLLNKVNGDPCDASEFVALVQGTIEALEDGGGGATIEIVDVVTIEPSEEARVENAGTDQALKLVFYIPKGADGVTPTIDPTTRHWMIGGVDTGILAQGADGQDGQDGAPGHNPCLGRFTAVPSTFAETPRAGDYYYVDTVDNTTTPPTVTETKIYKYDGTQWDSGTVVDVSNLTFATSEEVTNVAIDGTGLANPAENALAKAGDVKKIADKVADVEVTETQVDNAHLSVYDPAPNDGFSSGFWWNNNGTPTSVYFVTTNNESTKIDVSGYDAIRFLGTVRSKINYTTYAYGQYIMPTFCFLDANGSPILDSITPYDEIAEGETASQKEYYVQVPEGAKWFVCVWYQSGGNLLSKEDFYCYLVKGGTVLQEVRKEIAVAKQEVEGDIKTVTRISPYISFGVIQPSTGNYDTVISALRTMKRACTPRFIKTSDNVGITSSIACDVNIFCYRSDFSYIGNTGNQTVDADVESGFSIMSGTAYIKIGFSWSGDSVPMPIPRVLVSGLFDNVWDVYNERPADGGYHGIPVFVNVTNPTCCDEDSQTVQDSPDYKLDNGVICLPENYTHDGIPTRLIIYCHGGAVNYADGAVRFDEQDLEPEYWLAEGYAIMDMEGNPFNNDDEHFQIPQAMDCYVAGYKWAIEHYNLRRDGVFLGGRSMGGGMTFNLLKGQCPIPVIAACPNAAHGMCIGGTTPAGTNGARQEFYAIHCGFDIPSGFVWDNTNNPYYNGDTTTVGSKKKLLYDNWDKLVKNVPIWSLCTDLPTDDESIRALVDNHYVAGTGHSSRRVELWGKLHAMAKAPVKLFGCWEDASCPPADTALLYYRMLTNAAQIAEVRLFHSYKDYTGTGTTAHHYDTQDPALKTTVTTRYGETMTGVPIVYIEMLQFWRRYEQEN